MVVLSQSVFLIYLYSAARGGTGSVTIVTSPVPFLCSGFSLCGSNLSQRSIRKRITLQRCALHFRARCVWRLRLAVRARHQISVFGLPHKGITH